MKSDHSTTQFIDLTVEANEEVKESQAEPSKGPKGRSCFRFVGNKLNVVIWCGTCIMLRDIMRRGMK